MANIFGDTQGTSKTSFQIGISGTGARSLLFRNGFTGTMSWTPTAARTITIPDATGTIALTTNPVNGLQTLTDGATITWNCASGLNAKVTLAGNRTLAITNAATGETGTLIVAQDATGGRTLALPSGSLVVNNGAGAITLSTAASAKDILSWFYDGTNYFWSYGLRFS